MSPTGTSTHRSPLEDPRGAFTLVEVLIVVVIMGILTLLAVPNFSAVREKAQIARAIGDVRAISAGVTDYYMRHGEYPASLAEAGYPGYLDPWEQPYQYTVIAGSRGAGGLRKDRFLVPLNSDFDLYSSGPDMDSQDPLSAPASRDDIIRANDGGFIGIAEDF